MDSDAASLGFPIWVRLTHAFNFLFLTLLIRSGIEIIGAHPKFYWSDDALPGSEWLRFTKKKMPKDRLWTAEDEIEPLSPGIALPGRNNAWARQALALLGGHRVVDHRAVLCGAVVCDTPVAAASAHFVGNFSGRLEGNSHLCAF